jgi:dinuclear metal center YbgI/SA1388 family protein
LPGSRTTLSEIVGWIDRFAPFRYAASWDNCGLLVGDPEAEVERILVGLDPSLETIEEASEQGCQCLVTHHPLILKPIQAVRPDMHPGRAVLQALRAGLGVIAAHTNLDASRCGPNGRLSEMLGLRDVRPLEDDSRWREEETFLGMGVTGRLSAPESLDRLVDRLRAWLDGVPLRAVGDGGRSLTRVAVCSGSGGGLLDRVLDSGCEAFVTGDLKYHEAQKALDMGLALVDPGHFASERILVEPLAEKLRDRASRAGAQVEIRTASRERDPFWYKTTGED